jgi:hypothetical protein
MDPETWPDMLIAERKMMHPMGHNPETFREPIGFVDVLALLTLAGVIGTVLVSAWVAISSWLT